MKKKTYLRVKKEMNKYLRRAKHPSGNSVHKRIADTIIWLNATYKWGHLGTIYSEHLRSELWLK